MHDEIPYLCLALLPTTGFPQQFSTGFMGGGPAQPPIGESANKMPFVLGPTLSVGLFRGVTLETGLLFHRFGTTDQNDAVFAPKRGLTLGTDTWKARATEIPLLLRYHFLNRRRTWRPFVSAGPTVRRTSIEYNGLRSNEPVRTAETKKWNIDPAAGVGGSFRAWRVQI